MGMTMDEEIKRWTARGKSALVLEIIQGKTAIAEAFVENTFALMPHAKITELLAEANCLNKKVTEGMG